MHEAPLVVTAIAREHADAALVAGQLADRFPGVRFIGVVAADAGEDVQGLLTGLGPVLAELIFTTSPSPAAVDGEALSWRALDEWGHGQDFVYAVAALEDAIGYALDVLGREGEGRWEGRAILVPGGAATIEEARRAVARRVAEAAPTRRPGSRPGTSRDS